VLRYIIAALPSLAVRTAGSASEEERPLRRGVVFASLCPVTQQQRYEVGWVKGVDDAATGRGVRDWTPEEMRAADGWRLAGWAGYVDAQGTARDPSYTPEGPSFSRSMSSITVGVLIGVPQLIRHALRRT
jgi:hypothetical protein